MPRKPTPISEDFLHLQRRLADWRSSHAPRSPLAEDLWSAAVELARKHGLHRTARTLPIDYASLRKRLSETSPQPSPARPEFVELFPAPAPSRCCVEILRVQLSGPLDWNQLLRAWRSER
jgi:hypothetical protein